MIPGNDLRRRYHEGRLLPFLGAGVSMGVKWTEHGAEKHGPSWRELVDEAARNLGFDDPDLLRMRGNDFQILEYYRQRKHGHTELTNWLTRNMYPPDDALRGSAVHRELAALQKCKLFYTTNYDDFLERAFILNGRNVHTVAIEPHFARSGEYCEIVKFHGDWNHPDTMVLSESDYQERLALRTPMDWKLLSDLLNRAVLFIGYSFNDPNVSYVFGMVNKLFKNLPDSLNGRRAYITVPDPSEFEIALFGARNIEVIPVDGSKIGEELVEILKWMQS